jgi:hypothetical protein
MTRTFKASPAIVAEVPLLIGLLGPPGGGKTFSALRLATGIARVRGGEVYVIDTEGARATKYASRFAFQHVPFGPPYKPTDFLASIHQMAEAGAGAIVVDSMSDEHEGEGGVLDWHDQELDRMAGNDWQKRERVGQASWIKPKADRRKLIDGLLRIKTPIIMCFRAREKVKQIKNDRGRMEPTNIGYQPIAPMEIVHTLDLTCLLPPKADGVPVWKSDKIGEDFIIKLPEFLRPFITDGAQLSEEMGERFAAWARGDDMEPRTDSPAPQRHNVTTSPQPDPTQAPRDISEVARMGDEAAERGMDVLQTWWKRSLTPEEREALKAKLDGWKDKAAKADAEAAAENAPA